MFFKSLIITFFVSLLALTPVARAGSREDARSVSALTTQETSCVRRVNATSVVVTARDGKEFRVSFAVSRIAAAPDAPPAMMLQIWYGTPTLAESARAKEERNKAVLDAGGTSLEPSFDFSDVEAIGANYDPRHQARYELVLREILEAAASCEVTVASTE